MDAVNINEKKWATLLILSKMLNDELVEEDVFHVPVLNETRKISTDITLDGVLYEIENELFRKLLFELHFEKLISLPILTKNGYSYIFKDRGKISQRIMEFNSMGITLDKLKDYCKKNKEGDGLFFNSDLGMITFRGKNIKISKFTKQYYFLKAIFDSKDEAYKDWQFSEIAENMDRADDYNWKDLYNISDAICKKIAVETGVKDVFITTTQSIQINPRYIQP